jgi:hypothetical protein
MNPYPLSLLNHLTVPVAISHHLLANVMNGQERRDRNAINYSLERTVSVPSPGRLASIVVVCSALPSTTASGAADAKKGLTRGGSGP